MQKKLVFAFVLLFVVASLSIFVSAQSLSNDVVAPSVNSGSCGFGPMDEIIRISQRDINDGMGNPTGGAYCQRNRPTTSCTNKERICGGGAGRCGYVCVHGSWQAALDCGQSGMACRLGNNPFYGGSAIWCS